MKSLGKSIRNQLAVVATIALFLLFVEIATVIFVPSQVSYGVHHNWEQGVLSYLLFSLPSHLLYGLAMVLLFRLVMWPFSIWIFRKWQGLAVWFYLIPAALVLFAFLAGGGHGSLEQLVVLVTLALPIVFFLSHTHWYFHNHGSFGSARMLVLWGLIALIAVTLRLTASTVITAINEQNAEEERREQAAYDSRPAEWHRDAVKALFARYDQSDMERVLDRLGYMASPRNGQSDFVKIDANGAVLDREARRWSCVWDRTTSLLWQREPQSVSSEYSHIQEPRTYHFGGRAQSNLIVNEYDRGVRMIQPAKIQADAFLTPDDRKADPDRFPAIPEPENGRAWGELVAATNQRELCGQTDWRVPNVLEGMTLLAEGTARYFAFYDQAYWTSSPAVYRNREIPAGAVVRYADPDDSAVSIERAEYRFPVRLMSRDFTPEPPAEIVLLGGGFMLDRQTQLLWRHCPVQSNDNGSGRNDGRTRCDDSAAEATYAQFLEYREGILGDNIDPDDAGYDQWRLPTTQEFRSLYDCINSQKRCLVGAQLWPHYDAVESFTPYASGLFVTVDQSGEEAGQVLVELQNNRITRVGAAGNAGWMKLVRPATAEEMVLAEKYSAGATGP